MFIPQCYCRILQLLSWISCALPLQAEPQMDGRLFVGRIDPERNLDPEDILFFNEGCHWSDICAYCSFEPDEYSARSREVGTGISEILQSGSCGQFNYKGVVIRDGHIDGQIEQQRKLWYWTNERINWFDGNEDPAIASVQVSRIRLEIVSFDTGATLACARF